VQRSIAKRWWYYLLRLICRVLAVLFFQVRCFGRERIPATGGALVLANHQSNLDPVLIGMMFNRRLNYLARNTLFGFAPFRWLIRSLDAIPIDREGLGLSGLKETLKRIRRGEMVLMFPEGTRSGDGRPRSIKAGFSAVARRAGVPLLPLALDGAFDAWPRRHRFPRPALVRVEIGDPITPQDVARLDDTQLAAEVESRILACFERAQQRRGLTEGLNGSPNIPQCESH
jgi:1-acyl-sn-glycerol-3-phosphate acyltransferase